MNRITRRLFALQGGGALCAALAPRSLAVVFLLGQINTFDQGTGEYKDYKVFYASAFLQDDYKVADRVTFCFDLVAVRGDVEAVHQLRNTL